MDDATYSPFSHHSWFKLQPEPNPLGKASCDSLRMVNHVLCLITHGRATLRSVSRGQETTADLSVGTVHYRPADGEEYVILGQPATADHAWFGFLIPDGHLEAVADAEGVKAPSEYREHVLRQDRRLQAGLVRLASDNPADNDGKEEAARGILLRISALSGGGTPDWQRDESVFSKHTIRHIVAYIDAHLHVTPRLEELAALAGLSPSHFAKKFRHSTGLSPHRFINRRRLRASFQPLMKGTEPLAHIALDLGFSSQSHFTRVFSDLTGMTPSQYRRQFGRVVG